MEPSECKHMTFSATVSVARIEDVGAFSAELKLVCQDCGIPFKFLGMPAGSSSKHPTTSFGGEEARLPVAPMTGEDDAAIVKALKTFTDSGERKH